MIAPDRVRSVIEYDPQSGSFSWRVSLSNRSPVGSPAGHRSASGYLQISIDGRLYMAHQLAWLLSHDEWPPRNIDHIDMDRANNRLSNLRLATPSQNGANRGRQKNNSSGLKGVAWNKGAKRWRAQIKANGKRRHLGYFDTAEEAHAAYQEAAASLFGDFARTAR